MSFDSKLLDDLARVFAEAAVRALQTEKSRQTPDKEYCGLKERDDENTRIGAGQPH